jgi:predicted nucleotidyltransferase
VGRDRRGQVLFIDARKLGRMVDRTHHKLTDEDIQRIARTYHAWRGEKEAGEYADVSGFCKSATLEEIRQHGHVLTPGRYVGVAREQDDDEPFEQKIARLVAALREQQAEAARLDEAIWKNLKELGYDPKELLRAKREDILRLCAQYGARNVRVFGSVARGEADSRSDVDFLVYMEPGRSLFDLGGLQYELEQLLGCPVDVMTERSLKARIRDRILQEAVPL